MRTLTTRFRLTMNLENIQDKIRSKIWDRAWSKIRHEVCSHLRYEIWDQVWNYLDDQIKGQVRNPVIVQIKEEL